MKLKTTKAHYKLSGEQHCLLSNGTVINPCIEIVCDVKDWITCHISAQMSTGKAIRKMMVHAMYNPFKDEITAVCEISGMDEMEYRIDWFEYEPTVDEKTMIKDMITKKCTEEYGQTLFEFCRKPWY